MPELRADESGDPAESVAGTIAAAIRSTEPGSEQYRALLGDLNKLLATSTAKSAGGGPPGHIQKLVSTGGIVGLVAALGVLAPTVQSVVGSFVGPNTARLDSIEGKLDGIQHEVSRANATTADLVRFVEALDGEQARTVSRPPTQLPARLRALVALDDVADETD